MRFSTLAVARANATMIVPNAREIIWWLRFLHPDRQCNYTAENLDALTRQNFETNLFMTAEPCAGDTFS